MAHSKPILCSFICFLLPDLPNKKKSQGQKCYLAVPGFVLILDFFHRAVCQHVHHDLCTEPECIAEGFAIGQNIDLALSGHVGFKLLSLFFRECADQGITGLYSIIQSLGVLAVFLETALAGMDVAQIEVFKYLHFGILPSAIDELV